MAGKAALLQVICEEFGAAQEGEAEPWIPSADTLSFPPLLPVGNGKNLTATDLLLEAVRDYATLLRQNSSSLRASFSLKEFSNLVRLAFGRTLDALGSIEPHATELGEAVDAAIEAEISARKRNVDLLVGCWLVEEQSGYPIKIGPVRFQPRHDWLEEQRNAGNISNITYRRLKRAWSGNKLKPRKSGWDEHRETAISEAVDRCPIVCEVRTHGLSSDLVLSKGLLAARLAMTALALLWGDPKSALDHMNLIYDGAPRLRHYATIYETGGFGSGTSSKTPPVGQYSTEPLKPLIEELKPTFDLVGQALGGYVEPCESVSRTKVYNALFLSLWWFHEGCREASDQMAVTAFAASLDALAGGRKAAGIKKLIEARLGFKPSDALMKDGRNVNSVIDRIYDAARSRLIHGSSVDFVEDWSDLSATAQAVARLLLVQLTYWLHKNSEVTEMKAMQLK